MRYRTRNILENKKKKEFYSNYLIRGNNKFRVTDIEEKIDVDSCRMNAIYQFQLDNYISQNDKQIFINMNLFKSMLTDKIDTARIAPKKFRYKNSYLYFVQLKIPEGFHAKFIPENTDYDNGIYRMTIEYRQPDENTIEYRLYSHYTTLLLQPGESELYNTFLKKVYQNFRKTIVLEKNNIN